MKALVALSLLVLLAACGSKESKRDDPAPQPPANPTPTPASPQERARIHTELGAGYYGIGKYGVALQELKEAVDADPSYVPARNTLAVVYLALKEDDKARKEFEQALRIDPKDPEVNNNYGLFLCERKREKESIKYFMMAVRDPLYGRVEDAYVNAGICSRRAGDDASAADFFQRALKLKPDDARALINLAQLDYARGNLPQAKANLTRYMQLVAAPDAATLLFGARLSARLGDRNAMASYGSQLRTRFPGSPETRAFDEGRLE